MNTNPLNKLDEALRLIYLESAKHGDTQQTEIEMNRIMSPSVSSQMSIERERALLDGLKALVVNPSFGKVLEQNMKVAGLSYQALAEKTRLPLRVVHQLIRDDIYTNNIPIRILRDILSTLNISFTIAEKGIRNTFTMLQLKLQESVQNSYSALNPSFRKGHYISKSAFVNNAAKSNGKDLYENEQALDKYLKRLEELLTV